MSKLFVCGVLPEDAGKTTFTAALLHEASRRGLRACPFKPLSGHSYWWQYDSFKHCLSRRRLVCEDIVRLAEACSVDLPLEALNPVDLLLAPPTSLTKLLAPPSVQNYEWLAIGRFTTYLRGSLSHLVFYNETNLNEDLRELLDALGKALPVRSFKEFLELHQAHYHGSVESCFKLIEQGGFDLIVVEGFNDAVYPWRGVDDMDLVIAVAPGLALIYDTTAFLEAIKLSPDPYTTTFSEVASSTAPKAKLKLPPLSRAVLADPSKVAEKYRRALEDVLEPVT